MIFIKKGFTLIELLIVIAILGVLAVVVLVAINPVQQLARTRDAGRISSVQQLGHAMEAYFVSHDADYPAALADLVTAGEINAIPGEVTNTLSTLCTGNVQGWCMVSAVDSFAIWSALEADSNIDAGNCAAGGPAFTAYLSLSGQTCTVCAEPGAATVCP